MTKTIFNLFATKDSSDNKELLGTYTSLTNAKTALTNFIREKNTDKFKEIVFSIFENEMNTSFSFEKKIIEEKIKKNNSALNKIYKRMKEENPTKTSKENKALAFEIFSSTIEPIKLKTDKPKRTRSNFINFSTEYRKILDKENPTKTFAEKSTILGEKWKTFTPEEKEKFKTVCEETVKPEKKKKALTAYILFCKEFREIVMKENKDITFGDVGRELGKRWRELDDAKKELYKIKTQQ